MTLQAMLLAGYFGFRAAVGNTVLRCASTPKMANMSSLCKPLYLSFMLRLVCAYQQTHAQLDAVVDLVQRAAGFGEATHPLRVGG